VLSSHKRVVHVVGLIDSLYAPPLPQSPRVMQKRVAAHPVALKVGSRFFYLVDCKAVC